MLCVDPGRARGRTRPACGRARDTLRKQTKEQRHHTHIKLTQNNMIERYTSVYVSVLCDTEDVGVLEHHSTVYSDVWRVPHIMKTDDVFEYLNLINHNTGETS